MVKIIHTFELKSNSLKFTANKDSDQNAAFIINPQRNCNLKLTPNRNILKLPPFNSLFHQNSLNQPHLIPFS